MYLGQNPWKPTVNTAPLLVWVRCLQVQVQVQKNTPMGYLCHTLCIKYKQDWHILSSGIGVSNGSGIGITNGSGWSGLGYIVWAGLACHVWSGSGYFLWSGLACHVWASSGMYNRDWHVMYEWVQACIIGISMSCMSGAQSADPFLMGSNFAWAESTGPCPTVFLSSRDPCQSGNDHLYLWYPSLTLSIISLAKNWWTKLVSMMLHGARPPALMLHQHAHSWRSSFWTLSMEPYHSSTPSHARRLLSLWKSLRSRMMMNVHALLCLMMMIVSSFHNLNNLTNIIPV